MNFPKEEGGATVEVKVQSPYPFNMVSSEESEDGEQEPEEDTDLHAASWHPKPLGVSMKAKLGLRKGHFSSGCVLENIIYIFCRFSCARSDAGRWVAAYSPSTAGGTTSESP